MPLVPTPARFIPLRCPLFLPVNTVNCVQTLKDVGVIVPFTMVARLHFGGADRFGDDTR
jgi:hypothetical protein